MALPEDQHAVQEFTAQSTDEALADRVHPRSLDGAAQDPGAGSLEDGVERGSEIRSAITDQEPDVLDPLAEGESEVAGLLRGPVPGWVRGDAAQMHPAAAVLDEYQHVYALQQHGVHVQEIDRQDPGGLGCQELPPRRAGPARRRIDARSTQDLPHGGRRYGDAELRQFAMDPAMSPQRILLRQANHQAGDAPDRRRAAGLAPLARVVLAASQFAVPGQERRGRHGEDPGPAPARQEPCHRGEPHPVAQLVSYPAGMPAQHRVLVPEHEQFGIFRPVTAEHQDGQAEHPARQQVDDLEQHPASQPPLRPSRRQQCR